MPSDPRIRAFLDRAAAVVAASKGLTVECQQQLEVLATQLRLDPGQWNQCLNELKNQTRTERAFSRYEQAFLDVAEKNLASIAGRILSLGKEKLLLELAAEKFQIGQVRAHQLLETCCEELDIRRISRTDTEASFRELAINLIGSARRAAPETVSQLIDAGKGWGLTETEVRTIVSHVVVANARRRMRRISRAVKLLVLTAILAGMIVWSANLANRLERKDPSATNNEGDGSVAAGTPAPEWFPAERLDQMIGSLAESRQLADLCRRLSLETVSDRLETYSQITEMSLDPFGPSPESVAGLLDLLLSADPDREKLKEWETPFVAELETRIGAVPVSPDAMRRDLRLAEFAAQLDKLAENRGTEPQSRSKLAALNQWKLGGNGPAGLLLQWWAQLVYQEPVPVAKSVAAIGSLHQFSLQYLTNTLANQWQHRLLIRIVQANPDSVPQLDDELESSILASSQSELEAWIHVWQRMGPGAHRDLIGRLVLRHPTVDPEIASGGSVESSMNRMSAQQVQRRHATILQLQSEADESLQQARLAQLNRADTSESIAITAQAVNDALRVIVQSDPKPNRPGIGRNVSPWRFEMVANEPVTVAPGLTRSPPRATPADFRTFDDAMREFDSAAQNPERAGYRMLALEELQRIAPRLDDIPTNAATTLASWFLQEMTVEEWLAVEKSLPAFRFWPSFGLALSDRVANSPVKLDQAISITQLVADPGFRLDKNGDWRIKCSRALAKSVVHILEQQLLPAETKEIEQWQRARSALGRIYFSRRQILGTADGDSGGHLTPSDQAIRLAAAGLAPNDLGDSELQKAIGIGGDNELEITVEAAMIAARQLGEEMKVLLPSNESWNGFPNASGSGNPSPANLGSQLLSIEFELLEYITLIRRHQVNRITTQRP